jgi:MFS family permease
MLQAIMAWQVYQISGNVLDLGILGLVRFAPSLALSLVGGAVADSYKRKTIVLVAQALPLSCAVVFAVATNGDWISIPMIYGLVLLLGLAGAFEGPARSAFLPGIVGPELFPTAVSIHSGAQGLGFVSGPLIGGGLIHFAGVDGAYGITAALLAVSLASMAVVHYVQAAGPRSSLSVEAIKEGIDFVRSHQPLIGSITLDMYAVVFGVAEALLPVYPSDILKVGPGGYGLLGGSLAIGSFLGAVVLAARPPIRQAGRSLLIVVVIFGLGTIGFGLSRSFVLSLLLYGVIGAADQVSMVIRQTILQVLTPDELRGRVSAVSQIFINTSNQVGAMESAFVAALSTATFAVVSGGVGCLAVVSLVAWKLPGLRDYRTGDQQEEISAATEGNAMAVAAGASTSIAAATSAGDGG